MLYKHLCKFHITFKGNIVLLDVLYYKLLYYPRDYFIYNYNVR